MEKRTENPQYEPPIVKVVGSVYGLTQQIEKRFDASDGLTFMGTPIGNASP